MSGVDELVAVLAMVQEEGMIGELADRNKKGEEPSFVTIRIFG